MCPNVKNLNDMNGYLQKPAGGSAVIETDWRRGYLAPGECVTAILPWGVHAPRGGAPDLAVTAAAHDEGVSRLTVEGGRPGQVFMLIARVATDRGRALCRAVVVRVALDLRPERGDLHDPD